MLTTQRISGWASMSLAARAVVHRIVCGIVNGGGLWEQRVADPSDRLKGLLAALSSRLPQRTIVDQDGPGQATGARAPGRSVELWRAVVDAMPDAVIVLDAAGHVSHANALAVEVFPRLRIGSLLSHVARQPELIEALDRIAGLTDPIEVQIVEHVPVEKHLAARIVRLGVEPDEATTAPAFLVSFRDLSEHDRLAQMRADFVANASHELRTPLASLKGYIETLQGAARDDPTARERFLAVMAEQAQRMTRLIEDLLSLSRIEMRQHLAPRGRVDLTEAVASAVHQLEPAAAAAKVTVRTHPCDVASIARADGDEVAQVLHNLIHNAIKYGRQGGIVDVRITHEAASRSHPARIAVAISDDGPGIAAEHLPRLTERFYRVSAVQSREKGGTGLGLAIVKHIMNRHRGDLSIESAVGKGSTFTVVFEEAVGL